MERSVVAVAGVVDEAAGGEAEEEEVIVGMEAAGRE